VPSPSARFSAEHAPRGLRTRLSCDPACALLVPTVPTVRTVVFLVLGLSAILLNKSLHGKGWTPHTYHACAGAAALTGVVL
jgi:hypothetical protein